jgi:hypothetical protein
MSLNLNPLQNCLLRDGVHCGTYSYHDREHKLGITELDAADILQHAGSLSAFKTLPFTERECSVLCSQQRATGPCI